MQQKHRKIGRGRRAAARFARCGLAAVITLSALSVSACRAPGDPVDAWPAEPQPNGSVLDRTTAVPGQPEQRAPTAPPAAEPTPRPTPVEPDAPEVEPAPRTPSPHPPGVPGGPGQPEAPVGGAGTGGEEAQAGEAREEEVAPDAGAPGMREIFPNVRADLAARIVEFDGIVPIDVNDPRAPRVYLEVTVCTPDTKEHEALVMTRALPSHVHAALLAMDAEPGNPGGFKWDNNEMTTIEPAGDRVTVTFVYRDEDGEEREIPATKWVINAETGAPFAPEAGAANEAQAEKGGANARSGFVFAGSVMRTREGRDVYDADGVGTLVGLTTFGAETIAWGEVISPDSHIHTPEWIADPAATPPFGTAVTVRIRAGR